MNVVLEHVQYNFDISLDCILFKYFPLGVLSSLPLPRHIISEICFIFLQGGQEEEEWIAVKNPKFILFFV